MRGLRSRMTYASGRRNERVIGRPMRSPINELRLLRFSV
jgi:hypothetical protein